MLFKNPDKIICIIKTCATADLLDCQGSIDQQFFCVVNPNTIQILHRGNTENGTVFPAELETADTQAVRKMLQRMRFIGVIQDSVMHCVQISGSGSGCL